MTAINLLLLALMGAPVLLLLLVAIIDQNQKMPSGPLSDEEAKRRAEEFCRWSRELERWEAQSGKPKNGTR
jgi:hypothetical protein